VTGDRKRDPGSTTTGHLGYHAGMFGLDTVVVLLIVLAIVLMWRGPKMLPKWGGVLGRGVKAARKEVDELRRDADRPNGAPKP
jgi:Sec-independent protein translocase protein TatA